METEVKRARVIVDFSIEKKISNRVKYIYKNTISHIVGDFKKGDIVDLYSKKGNFLGQGFINPDSKKNLIIILTWSGEEFNEKVLMERLNSAVKYRFKYALKSHESFRIVDDINDLLPGLIIDKLKDLVVINVFTPGWLNFLDYIMFFIDNRFDVKTIYLNIPKEIMENEKMPYGSKVLKGEISKKEYVIEERGFKFLFDFTNYREIGVFFKTRSVREYLYEDINLIDKRVLLINPTVAVGAPYLIHAGIKQLYILSSSKDKEEFNNKILKLNSLMNSDVIKYITSTSIEYLKKNSEKFDVIILGDLDFSRKDFNEDDLKSYGTLQQLIFGHLKKGGIYIDMTPEKFNNINNYKNLILDIVKSSNMYIQLVKSFSYEFDKPLLLTGSILLNYSAVSYRVI